LIVPSIKTHQLKNKNGIVVNVLNYGAIVQSIMTPEGDELLLGFQDINKYLKTKNPYFFGATIGRVANRIANGQFNYQGHTHHLERNENNKHCLHSGRCGLHQVFFSTKLADENRIQFFHKSLASQNDFPGTVQLEVIYELNNHNEFIIEYRATTDKITPLDLTNHTYWNLTGRGNIFNHEVKLNADHYLPLTNEQIPTGQIINTYNTPFDFSHYKPIGKDIAQLTDTKGYDHYFIINPSKRKLRLAAAIKDKSSGRMLTIFTTQPGFQFYTGNFLKGTYKPYSGFCIETQNYPNAINQKNFPSILLHPNELYQQKTIYQLSLNV
jgi:aldose 1-epimerase